MRTIILAIALVLTTGAPGVALARTQQSEQQYAASLQAWLADLAQWTTGYQALYLEQTDVMLAMMDDAETAMGYYASGDHARGRAWAQTWSAQTRAALRSPVERGRLIDSTPPALPAGLASASPQLAQLSRQAGGLPDIYVQLLETTDAELSSLIASIAATAGGDDAAAAGLPAKVILVAIAQLRGEIAMSEGGLPLIRASGGVQEHLVASGIATNHAAIAVLRYQQRLLEGVPADATATAFEIDRRVAEMHRSMDAFEAATAQMNATLASMPDSAAQLRQQLRRVVASLPESARIEREIAAQLSTVSRGLRGPRADDVDQLVEAWDPIDPLLTRRLELDAQRRAILAGG